MSTLAPGVLPPRAVVAQLRLGLRAAEQEAAAAEAEESEAAGLDHGAARDELRAKLALLQAQRREALDAELSRAGAEAAASIAAAHAEASAILAATTGGDAEPYQPRPPALIAELPLFDDEWSAHLGFSPPATLPRASRAEIARLRLQLRTTLDDAAAAEEAACAEWDLAGARSELGARLQRLRDERRAVMDDELRLARASGAAAVASARQQAAELISRAWSVDVVPAAGRPWLRAEAAPVFEDVPWLRTDEVTAVAPTPRGRVDDLLDELDLEPWVTGPHPTVPPDVAPPARHDGFDREELARIVAIAVAAALAERDTRAAAAGPMAQAPPVPWTAGPAPAPVTWQNVAAPWWAPAPSPPPTRSRPGESWHADLLLWLVAAAIGVLVLLAWVA